LKLEAPPLVGGVVHRFSKEENKLIEFDHGDCEASPSLFSNTYLLQYMKNFKEE